MIFGTYAYTALSSAILFQRVGETHIPARYAVEHPATTIADDKAVYAYVPKIIRYYLGEDPILNNVETYQMSDPTERRHVLGQIENSW